MGSDSEEMAGDVNALARPENLRPAQSMDSATSKSGKGSVFARPNTSMLLKKKMSMPALTESKKKKLAARRKSSRYLLSQDRATVAEHESASVRKQRSNAPAIIQPSNYQQRKSGKRASALVQPTTERKKEKEEADRIIASDLQPLKQRLSEEAE